jgi:hypothetical protein
MLRAVVKIVESANTSPANQHQFMEVLKLNVNIVIIIVRQEAEFWTTECVLLQVYRDDKKAELLLNEKTALAASADCDENEQSSQVLLQCHRDLQAGFISYSGDNARPKRQAKRLAQAGISKQEVNRIQLFRHIEQCMVSCCWWKWAVAGYNLRGVQTSCLFEPHLMSDNFW